MKIYPAIDLIGGKAVRLEEGRRDACTVYHDAPVELAEEFAAAGAARVHVVDLDGAFAKAPVQLALIAAIVRSCRVPVQVGGGLRSQADVEAVFAAGAQRAVLGSSAVQDPALVEALCRAHPGRIVVAVDAKDGMVAVDGWTATSTVSATELAGRAARWGAAAVLYTDIRRDGTSRGPNVVATAALAQAVRIEVIASGGVGSLADVRALVAADIASVVIGRALYERRFTVAEAVAAGATPHGRCG